MTITNGFLYEFHVSRQARDHYQFDETLFATTGNVIFTNFHASRLFAQKINSKRDLVAFPEQAIRAGQLNAMGLIDEILHMVAGLYREQRNPIVMEQALDYLYQQIGHDRVNAALRRFAEDFPPGPVYRKEISPDEYIEGESRQDTGPGGAPIVVSNRQVLLEEMLLLWLANDNPAFAPFLEFFDDGQLEKETHYPEIINHLRGFFDLQEVFGPDAQNLVDMLRSPALAVPHSLTGQLEYIRERWGALLGKYLYRLLSSLDLVREEEKAVFLGPGPSRVYEFAGLEREVERFSQDKDWMPGLVLIAKNAYVWLDQLSKQHRRAITRLDQVPDEELDRLARDGFSGLWLIGLWERSAASKRIKQLRGNPEAVASAYSLFDYQIAADLGGDEAYRQLRDRAWQRGIRLASDMVPNHMGIDSRWVIEHPGWFVSLDYSPFPSYTFNGPNLSWEDRAGIYLEDHYFDNSDAAVVFKRVDNLTGSARYVYHGNDGTSTPWNDTAQLNYLLPKVREAVIQTILSVARKFPIIRFDAAMTLAKKHYQRLWFPEPGAGGAIPSRAEHGLSKEQFDELMPVEFWREVVDRVAREVPDTLLLAEAFWMMEGYFVRTLGMHRVYNSAFMNMLRDEKNAEYRLAIKNTLEFDPEILKRYVNFMNNPDERTAIDQFGSGDKYFGICVMMATLPGLPMFGHGQIEGFTEKYGMEYRRAYWDETPDRYLVERHEREIFPLLRRRYLFAEVRDFLLYDFYTPEGRVNEDVFAYSNRAGEDERSLVIYHNKYASARGWIRTSSAYSVKTGPTERTLVQKSLGEGLGLSTEPDMFCIFRDSISGMEYIRSNGEIYDKGLYWELDAYQFSVFTEFRQAPDNEWRQYAHLASYLDGRGAPSIDEALKEIFLQPVHFPFRELVNDGFFRWVIDNRIDGKKRTLEAANTAPVLKEARQKSLTMLREIKRVAEGTGDEESLAEEICSKLEIMLHLPVLEQLYPKETLSKYRKALRPLAERFGDDPQVWGTMLGWLFTHKLGALATGAGQEEISRSWIDEWLLGKILASALKDLGLDERQAWRSVNLIKILIGHQNWCESGPDEDDRAVQILESWLRDGDVQLYLGVNRYQGTLWFNKESFDDLLAWLYTVAVIGYLANKEEREGADGDGRKAAAAGLAEKISACYEIVHRIQAAHEASGYQVEKLLEAVKARRND